MSEQLRPARAVAPGRILERELEERGWTQRDLAEIMGRPHQAINEIVRGTKHITPDTAIELGQALDTSPELWNNLEANYRLALARKERADDDQVARKARLFSLAPIAEVIRRGWIKATNDLDVLEREVCQFLRISSPQDTPQFTMPPLRVTEERGPEVASLITWVRRVEHLAMHQEVAPYEPERLRQALPTLLTLVSAVERIAEVPLLLQSLGVHFVIVRHLPKTYLDGAACTCEGRPVVALTLRHDRIDAFWFTLLHELAHIVEGHDGLYLDNFDDKELNQHEHEVVANKMASDWLLDPTAFAAFKAQRPFSRERITVFAAQQHTHPAVVLGRLQYEHLVPYKNMRDMLAKVSPLLSDWMDTPGT